MYPVHLSGLSRSERRDHAMMGLDLVKLSHRTEHYPKELSGSKQRVAIARAILRIRRKKAI